MEDGIKQLKGILNAQNAAISYALALASTGTKDGAQALGHLAREVMPEATIEDADPTVIAATRETLRVIFDEALALRGRWDSAGRPSNAPDFRPRA